MVDFRLPDVLDPDYVDLNPRRVPAEDLVLTPNTTLEERFREACEYGQALWRELAGVRRYLRDRVAGSGASMGEDDEGTLSSEDALLNDTASWQQWGDLYAEICSTLAGTSGDSGFGRSEATLIARSHGVELRRSSM
ncbi:MAG TPA: hypothetical protein VGL26_06295 [Jatrophihabitans sp.]|jgi:hypothetical protein